MQKQIYKYQFYMFIIKYKTKNRLTRMSRKLKISLHSITIIVSKDNPRVYAAGQGTVCAV